MPNQPAGPSRTPARRRRNIMIGAGLGCIAVLACFCVVGAALFIYFGARYGGDQLAPAADLTFNYSLPGSVAEGDTFEFVLRQSNTGSDGLTVSYIDLASSRGSILDGAEVVSTDPAMERVYTTFGTKSFMLNRVLNPGETVTVTFALQATTPGEHSGQIAIGVGSGGMSVTDIVRLTVLARQEQ